MSLNLMQSILNKIEEYNKLYNFEEIISERITTKEYALPIIEEFVLLIEQNVFTIKYSYDDSDDVIDSVYILCISTGEKTNLTRSRGNIKFENIEYNWNRKHD